MDDNKNGLDVMDSLWVDLSVNISGILIIGYMVFEVCEDVIVRGYYLFYKLVKFVVLWVLVNKLLK